jgi:hypothetical protein
MRQDVIINSVSRRVSTPANLLMVVLVGGMFCLFRLLMPPPVSHPVDYLSPFLLLFGHLTLDPVPWQWTGDERGRANLGRGFVQALLFDAAWISLVLVCLHLVSQQGPLHHPEAFAPPLESPHLPLGPMPPRPLHHGPWRPFFMAFTLGLVNLAFGLAYGWVSAEKEATEERERATAGLLRQAQAKALQNQLEPHVLYNALNGLAELVHEDPLAAEEAIAKLADLYRMLTVHGNQAAVPLGLERTLVEAYLDMEQMRLGERLEVTWNWPGWADPVLAPPLLLLPLVENAIKHGIGPADVGGRVEIACAREGAAVRLEVRNTGAALGAEARRGVGLGNLEQRLALRPELAGRFDLGAREGWTEAVVQWIPEAG